MDQSRLINQLQSMVNTTDQNKKELNTYARQIELDLQKTDKNLQDL